MDHKPVPCVAEPEQVGDEPAPETARVIAALLANPNMSATAEALGIGRTTLWRTMQNADFQRAYCAARRHLVGQAIAQLQQSTGLAVQTLRDVIANGEAPIWGRIVAARIVLELAIKAVEVEDFDARLTALEEAQKRDRKQGANPNA
jgi:lambda repressor-like predicted transcriptional regulator